MLDPKPINGPHHQITIAPRGIAVRLRFRRPIAVPPVGRAMESLRGRDVNVERPVGFPLGVVDDGLGSNVGADKPALGRPIAMHRKPLCVVVGVHVVAEVLLLLIGDALDGLGLDFRAGQRRQKQPGENGDDGDDDQKLDERERNVDFGRHVLTLLQRNPPLKC